MPKHNGLEGGSAKIPIVIGVTGHRDVLESADGDLTQRIREVLQGLSQKYPHSELILLSALAAGADRLAAHAALELPHVRLVVPLPMLKLDYEREFTSAESVDEFRELLDQAVSWFELPIAERQFNESGILEEPRNRPYGELGWYIARHSHLLLALWDGDDANGTSGTAKVVSLKLRGLPRPDELRCRLSEPSGIGPVYHVVSPRCGKQPVLPEAYSLRVLYPDCRNEMQDSRALYDGILARIDDYNHEVEKLTEAAAEPLSKSRDYLTGGIDLQKGSALLLATIARYTRADVLAAHYKLLHQRAILWLALLASLGFTCLEVYHKLLYEYAWGLAVLLGFPVALALALMSIRRSMLYHDKFLSYRALAEGMRVQYFWLALGVKWRVPDQYLDKHRGELQWVRWAIMAWVIPLGTPGRLMEAGLPLPIAERIGYLREQWVRDQEKYFHRRIGVNTYLCDRGDCWRNTLFRTAVVVAVILLLSQLLMLALGFSDIIRSTVETCLVLVVALAFVIGGAISHYAEKMTYSEELLQYSLAHRRFCLAYELIGKAIEAGRQDIAQQLIRELGQEALWENADWVQLHQQRPPSVPQA